MTLRIRHIEAIARQEGRDVVFLEFYANVINQRAFLVSEHHWEALPIRIQIIEWLDNQKISWDFCALGDPEDEDFNYFGAIYIKVPYDETNSDYQKLKNYFEYPDDSMKIDAVNFCYFSLFEALKNSNHDDPAFWEKMFII